MTLLSVPRPFFLLTALAAIAPAAHAQDDVGYQAAEWTITGELGYSVTSGNRRSENLNAKFLMAQEDERSRHQLTASALRAKSEVMTDLDGDGVAEAVYQTSANRHQIAGTTAIKVNEFHNWFGAARYERDDFSRYDYQGTFSFGYGHHFFRDEVHALLTEIGPGYRRARERETQEIASDMIVRGLLDYRRALTENTQLTNTLLVESGSDNTFAQNDLGLSVAMNQSLALKAAFQVRHNSKVDHAEGVKKTDTLGTVNLVYTFK